MTLKYIITSFFLFGLVNCLWAEDQQLVFTCPTVQQLHHNPHTLKWTGPSGWKSYSQSFATKIDHFSGAQWTGVEVGQITCIYKPATLNTFAVSLVFNKLTYEPKGENWGDNKGGYRNCLADDPADCSFKVKPAEKAGDPYQTLENYKTHHTAELEQAF